MTFDVRDAVAVVSNVVFDDVNAAIILFVATFVVASAAYKARHADAGLDYKTNGECDYRFGSHGKSSW
jgi:hypothetical protein